MYHDTYIHCYLSMNSYDIYPIFILLSNLMLFNIMFNIFINLILIFKTPLYIFFILWILTNVNIFFLRILEKCELIVLAIYSRCNVYFVMKQFATEGADFRVKFRFLERLSLFLWWNLAVKELSEEQSLLFGWILSLWDYVTFSRLFGYYLSKQHYICKGCIVRMAHYNLFLLTFGYK